MHTLIRTFHLDGMSTDEFTAFCDEVAPVFAELPGLIEKVWLAQPETGTFGGVYLWRDQAACAQYRASDLFQQICANPHFATIVVQEYAILDSPTLMTSNLIPRDEHVHTV
jgi:quinol monooxygenase YgiN